MSWTLLRGTFRRNRSSLFWFSLSLALYSWMIVWFWDQMGGEIARLTENYPPEMIAMFGGDDVSFATVGGFFQVEYLGLMWMIIVASAVVLYAGRAFSGEIGSGTMELLLAQPLSRTRVAVTRVAALAGYALVLNFATFAPIRVFGPAYGIDLSTGTYLTLAGLGTLFILAVGGFAMLLSSAFRDSGKPTAIASGVLLTFWIADLVGNVSEAAEVLDPVNIVSYWQPGAILNGAPASSGAWWLFGLLALTTLAGSVVVFSRRDVS